MTEVLVVGTGSIGARHARNLASLGADVTVTDVEVSRAAALANEVGGATRPLDAAVFDAHSAVVIASPTNQHATQAAAALAAGARVLIEKPMAVSASELAPLEQHRDRVMVGYNLRHHAPVEQLVGLVHSGRLGSIMSVRLWFGSWLPDWRPGVDYRESYSARAELGGGVLLDAIHELDLLLWIAGDARFEVVGATLARLSALEIDVEDTVRALLRHDDGWVAEIALDYVSRRYRRGIEVIGSEATARLDWAREVVELEDADEREVWPAARDVDPSYVREAERFLAFVEQGTPPAVDGVVGAQSVRLAEQIRAAAP